MSTELSKSIQYLKSIGPKRAESFSQIGINTIKDLLYYFPSRYLDRTNILKSIDVLKYVINGFDGEITIIGKVVESETIYANKKNIFKVKLKDSTGFFECVWFQGSKYFKDVFNEGQYFAISSKPVLTRYGHLQFVHPDFDRISEIESQEFLNTGKIIPFYRLPKQLRQSNIGDFSLRKIIQSAINSYSNYLEETLPNRLIEKHNFLPINQTIKNLHFPENYEMLNSAKKRIKYEEIFYFECLVAQNKFYKIDKEFTSPFKVKTSLVKDFLSTLSFELTKSQLNVLSEIRKDLESNKPMNRLLQGDVGSGKTIVALISMLFAIDNNSQCAFLVPTEILADQHFKTISRFLNKFNIKIELFISSVSKSNKAKIIDSIKNGETKIVIGTHALLEDNIEFNNLGLIVIDEQHRFGVLQRYKLVSKGNSPNILIMTATPIPRTLSMTIYGDLDVSIIDEMPKNRKPIKTILRGENKLPDIFNFILQKNKDGYQAFIVYPLVEESEKIELKAATTYYEEIKNNFLPSLKIGLIHGKLSWQEKEKVMFDFANKLYDVLVSTTVIEVGIDIPDANIIVINDAERFGLSQLHQLRGRVGRSDKQAYCILVTKNELALKSNNINYNFEYLSSSEIEKHKAAIRLNAMIKYSSGFDLAEIDFKLRGPGNIFGTEQSGIPNFRYINLVEDVEIITKAKEDAFHIINEDKFLLNHSNTIIKNILEKNYSSQKIFSSIA
ncbi:MAG: ATP-dependent DNA helicase RecG [Melioribacteraceae bacterium]|nr:ATP-dependent DNA helicase RecG [Melioribacteraceae bacterium]